MAITIRFQGGQRAGETVAFDDSQQRITLGRDAAQCDVVFPAEETQVGREHFALIRELGRYRVSLNQENLVLINGQPAIDEQELPPTADLQIGPNGPKLVIETMHNQSLPSTAFQGKRPGQPTMIRSAGKSAAAGRRIAVLAVLLLIAGSAIGYFGWKKHDVDVQDVGKKVAKAEENISQTQAQVQEIVPKVESLNKLTDEQRKVLAGVSADMAQMEKKLEDAEPKLLDVIQKASPSVYLVLVRDADGEDYPQATAWVVDKAKGILATNGHVAELFPPPGSGSKLMVRSNGKPAKTYVVKSAETHPGYEQFQQLWAQYNPAERINPVSAAAINPAGPACDVALLHLESKEGLADALEVASQEVLDSVGPAYPVGYVGYPMEGLALGGVNTKSPTPTRHMAYISSVTDFFGDSNVDSSQRLLVQHALPATGGASGSPIINRDGHVVAVLNAGNVIGLAPRARIGSPVNIAFAQRADLVRELLEGKANVKQTARRARWQGDIARNFKRRDVVETEVKVVRDRIASNTIRDWRSAQDSGGDYTVKFTTLSDQTLDAKPITRLEANLAGAGPCLVMAYDVAGDYPVLLRAIEVDQDQERTYSGLPTNFHWARFLRFDGHDGGKVTITVASEADQARIALKAYHAVRTRIPVEKRLESLLDDWKKSNSKSQLEPVTAEIVSESKGQLPEPLSPDKPAVSKVELTLEKPGDYFLFISTPGDDKIAMVAARKDGLRLDQLASDQRGNPTAYGSFRIAAKSDVVIFVLGVKKDVPFDLKLYRAVLK